MTGTEIEGLSDWTLGQLLDERARKLPDRTAFVARSVQEHGAEVSLTYRELQARARAAAAGLLRFARPGEHVALVAPNVLEWVVIEFGAALAGLVTVAVNPALSDPELVHVLAHSRAVAVLYAREYGRHPLGDRVARAAAASPAIRSAIAIEDARQWQGDGETLPRLEIAPDAPAMLQYTSGTVSGRPKGVLLSHRSIVNEAKYLTAAIGLPDGAAVVTACPAFHTAGCVAAFIGPIWRGGYLTLLDGWDPGQALEAVDRTGARWMVTVATMLGDIIAEGARRAGQRLPDIPTITTGAANVPSSLVLRAQELFGSAVHNSYGLTEMSSVACLVRAGRSLEEFSRTVGTPLPYNEVKIIDSATGEDAPPGMPGEVCMRGFGRLIAYFDDEAANHAIDDDGWLHTGDLGLIESRGNLVITGRLKEIIIRGGENIAPKEIEDRIAELPFVAQACVVGVPDDRLGERVAAVISFVDRADEHIARLERIRDHCLRALARYKVPQSWFVVEALPMTASQKVKRSAVQEQVTSGTLLPVSIAG